MVNNKSFIFGHITCTKRRIFLVCKKVEENNDNGNYDDVISTNLRNFLPGLCCVTTAITILQSKYSKQVWLNNQLRVIRRAR